MRASGHLMCDPKTSNSWNVQPIHGFANQGTLCIKTIMREFTCKIIFFQFRNNSGPIIQPKHVNFLIGLPVH